MNTAWTKDSNRTTSGKTAATSWAQLPYLMALVITMMLPLSLAAQSEPLQFSSLEEEMRFVELTMELRCVVCQNQNLADSDAPLAQDLRQEIYDMMQEGKNNEEIKTFLVERYGDFVLYRPAMAGNTLALWLIPGVLLALGAIGVAFSIRNRNRKLAAINKGEES